MRKVLMLILANIEFFFDVYGKDVLSVVLQVLAYLIPIASTIVSVYWIVSFSMGWSDPTGLNRVLLVLSVVNLATGPN